MRGFAIAFAKTFLENWRKLRDYTEKASSVREPFPCCRLFAVAYYFFCFFVSIKCRIARTGWWKIIRGPLQRMTWRMASRIWGL